MQCAPSIEVDPHSIAPPVRQDVIEVKIVDPTTNPDWDRIVTSWRGSTVFHRAAWAKVLHRTYGHRPLYLQFYRGIEPVALVPMMEVVSPFTGRRGISLPFSDVCEPLISGEWERGSLMTKLEDLSHLRKWRYFELRGGRESLPESAIPAEKYYGHKLDLRIGLDGLLDSFHSSVRRALRKAEKAGLAAEIGTTWEPMRDFYKLHARTRRRHGLPPQSWSFFNIVLEEVIKPGLGFIVIVRSGTKPVAAAVFFHSGSTGLYKFGASDERSQELRGNNLAVWEGIKCLADRNVQTLHFGRTSIDNEGLRRFKLAWRTKEELIEYFKFDVTRRAWSISTPPAPEFHHHLFRRMPLAANRVAGALIYRHLD
jgi:hypothetical protein